MERVLAELVRGLAAAGDCVTVIARSADIPNVPFVFFRVRGPSRPFVIAYPWFAIMGSLMVRRHRRGIVQATGAIVLNRVDFVAIHFCHRAFGRQPGASTASRNTLIFRAHARLARALARLGERLFLRPSRIGGIIAVSTGVASEVLTLYPRFADRVTVVPNGVDRARFSRRRVIRAARRDRVSPCQQIRRVRFLLAVTGAERALCLPSGRCPTWTNGTSPSQATAM